MMQSNELLQYIYKTTEMGRDGIQSVLKYAEGKHWPRTEGSVSRRVI